MKLTDWFSATVLQKVNIYTDEYTDECIRGNRTPRRVDACKLQQVLNLDGSQGPLTCKKKKILIGKKKKKVGHEIHCSSCGITNHLLQKKKPNCVQKFSPRQPGPAHENNNEMGDLVEVRLKMREAVQIQT